MSALDHTIYALAWLSFGALHSWLASASAKAHLGRYIGSAYRLAYNGLAVFHLAAVWMVGRAVGQNAEPFDVPVWAEIALAALAVAGVLLMLRAVREYDLARFAGLWQLHHRVAPGSAEEDEPLSTGGLHRWVRHPVYSAAFMILWGLVRDPLSLATASWGSLYLIVGTRLEERKLRKRYGEAYRRYQSLVPAFIPWRGRPLPSGSVNRARR